MANRGAIIVQGVSDGTPIPVTLSGGSSLATGDIVWSAAANATPGRLRCDGSAVSRSTYAGLYAVIGTTFGVGDGSTTFTLPDLSGRSPVGTGTGAGLTARALGDAGGEEAHQLTTPELAAHLHAPIFGAGNFITDASGTYVNEGGNAGGAVPTTDNAGGDQPHNTMHPFLALSAFIIT